MRIFIIMYCCLVSALFTNGQSVAIDSLKDLVLKGTGDHIADIKTLDRLKEAFQAIGEYDSSLVYTRVGIHYVPDPSDTAFIDTTVIRHLIDLGAAYQFSKPDSAIRLSTWARDWARRIQFRRGEANACFQLAENYRVTGDIIQAIELFFESAQISKQIQDSDNEQFALAFMGIAYLDLGEYRTGLNYMNQAMAAIEKSTYVPIIPFMMSNIGEAYEKIEHVWFRTLFPGKGHNKFNTFARWIINFDFAVMRFNDIVR